MRSGQSTLQYVFWLQRFSVVAAAVALFWFGFDPLLRTFLNDLGINPGLAPAAAAVLGIAAAVVGVLTLERLRRGTDGAADHIGAERRRFAQLLVAALLLSGAAIGFSGWDAADLEAWRMARGAEAGSDVTKRQSRMHGTHVATFETAGPGTGLASVRLPGSVQKWGGTLRVAVRANGVACAAGESLYAQPASGDPPAVVVDLAGLCEAWRAADIELPAGSIDLQLRLTDGAAGVGTVAVAALGLTRNAALGSAAILILAIALPLAAALFLAFPKPAGDTRHQRSPAIDRRKAALWSAASLGVFLVVANLGTYAFVAAERTIYAWDFGGHWISAVNVANAFRPQADASGAGAGRAERASIRDQASLASLRQLAGRPGPLTPLIRSVRHAEYNPTAAIPVAIPMALAEPTRLAYELSLVNVYALATVLVLTLALAWLTRVESLSIPAWWTVLPALVVLLFNPFWVPIARGYLGVSVVVADLLVLWLYFRRPITTHRIRDAILIGLLLAVSVLFRRWNAYFVVGFFVLLLADSLWHVVRTRSWSGRALLEIARAPTLIGLTAVAALSVIAWPVVVRMLTTDYADIYSAYADDAAGLAGHIAHFVRAFGIGLIVLIAAAAVYLVRAQPARRVAVLLLVQLAVILVHFSRTQAMGPHHLYLLMPAIFVLLGAAMIHAFAHPERRVRLVATGLVALYAVNGIASHVAVFAPAGDSLARALVPILPDNRRLPLVRNDLAEFARLASYVDAHMTSLPADARVYVLASSTVFSQALLRRLEVSTGSPFAAAERMFVTAAIDKRDGFPRGLIDADLVLVGDPAQIHRRSEDQQVVEIPTNNLLTGTGFGAAFEKLPAEFELDQGVRVYAYRRTRPNSAAEITALSERLRALYPDRPNVYRY